jgi:hypothetical protein
MESADVLCREVSRQRRMTGLSGAKRIMGACLRTGEMIVPGQGALSDSAIWLKGRGFVDLYISSDEAVVDGAMLVRPTERGVVHYGDLAA